ncbi:MAG: hypothetical protein COA36_12350 [Desulfotalea sp.]|nr:MAG: hypothetical protein COA36_12350 [Desulfotalea sp.]
MEPGFYFTALVFAVATLHLINRAVFYVNSIFLASGMKPNHPAKTANQRDDWYMFFHRSALYGNMGKQATKRSTNNTTSSPPECFQRRDPRPALRKQII